MRWEPTGLQASEATYGANPAGVALVDRLSDAADERQVGEPSLNLVLMSIGPARAHRRAPWELTTEEWSATQSLLRLMMNQVSELHMPGGWDVGWNVGAVAGQVVEHAHCHLVPRYADEPFAGRGLHWWFKQAENARPAQ